MLTFLILLILAGLATLAATYKYWRVYWKQIGAGLATILLLGGSALLFPTPAADTWQSASFGGSILIVTDGSTPAPPTALSAISHNVTCLNVSFSGVARSVHRTLIERNATAVTSWARGAGTEVYNSTGSTADYELDYPLTSEVTYYYQAWCQNVTSSEWSATNTSANGAPEAYDTTPPAPSPLTWASEPAPVSASEISMESVDATDASEPIFYYFNETSGHEGGSSSGAQNEDKTFTDDQLEENTDYTYLCQARDSNATPNWGAACTNIVTIYTWVIPPTNGRINTTNYGDTWINVTASACNNPTGGDTDCYMDCDSGTVGDANYPDTGWTATPSPGHWYYNFTGLSTSTQYGFKIKYRNGDSVETAFNADWQNRTTLSGATITWQTAAFGGTIVITEGGSFTWQSASFGGSVVIGSTGWGNWSNWWQMHYLPTSSSVIGTSGVDYIVWIGSNVSAYHVAQYISDAGVTWSSGEYIALWDNDTWSTSRALWNWSLGTNPSANNWTIHTFDILQTYITDAIGDVTIDVTANPSIDFSAARNVSCTDTGAGSGGNRGYNFVAFTPGSSTLEYVSETNLNQLTGEWVGLWGTNWDFWIANISPSGFNKNVAQYSVLQIKVTSTRYLNMN